MTEYYDQARERANKLLETIDTTRTKAVDAGMDPDAAGKLGAEAEAVALDVITLSEELRASGGAHTALGLVMHHVRSMNEILDAHVEGRALPGALPEEPEAPTSPTPEPTPADLAAMGRAVRKVEPEIPPAVPPAPDGPVASATAPTGADTSGGSGPSTAAVAPLKRRAPETARDLGAWEPEAADLAALPWEEAWIRAQLAAFHTEHAGKTGARPRVTFAAWLKGRDGSGEHGRKTQA